MRGCWGRAWALIQPATLVCAPLPCRSRGRGGPRLRGCQDRARAQRRGWHVSPHPLPCLRGLGQGKIKFPKCRKDATAFKTVNGHLHTRPTGGQTDAPRS